MVCHCSMLMRKEGANGHTYMNSVVSKDENTCMKISDKMKHSRQCILLNNLRDNHEKKHRLLPKKI